MTLPGVRIKEGTVGAIPAVLNRHDTVYMFGSATTGDENKLYYVSSYTDFTNVFGASPSSAAVALYFQQDTGSGLYFVRVKKKAQRTITVTTFTPGTVVSLTVSGITVSYTCVTGDTATTARNALGNLVNQNLPGLATYHDGIIRYNVGTVVSSNTNVTLGTETAPDGNFKVNDIADAMAETLEPGMRQGFLLAPEFFKAFSLLNDRTLLQAQMEKVASSYNHVALIDCGEATANSSTLGEYINLTKAERDSFISPTGHSWYTSPYVKDANNVTIPSSVIIAGVALRRYRQESYAQPVAGTSYPVYGVRDVTIRVPDNVHSILNDMNVNVVRNLSRGRGIVVYGARTLSTNAFYRFGNTRVILNVLASSLKDAFDQLVFSLVDGQGLLFSRAKQTASAICEILRQEGALFGATPSDAYLVICDLTNNNPNDLEAGILNLDVVVKISPTLEVLLANIIRAALGTVLAEIVNTSNPNPTGSIAVPTE